MAFDMQCNMCGVSLRLQESQSGSIINCPSCGQVIFVQSPPPAAAFASTPAPQPVPLVVAPLPAAPEPGLPDFMRPADEPITQSPAPDAAIPKPSPQFASHVAPELDLGSSLSEMLGSEEQPNLFSLGQQPQSPIAPQSHAQQEAIDLQFLSPKSEVPECYLPGAADEPSPIFSPATGPSSSATSSVPAPAAKQQSRLPLMVGVYASGVILGLIVGKFIFGKPAPTGLELIRDDGANKHKTQWITPSAPVPPDQRKKVGETVHLGHLAVTAMGVERNQITLERTDPFSGAKETTTSPEECLIIHVRLKNTSPDVEFAPLDETFLRPHIPKRRPTYSFIELEGGKPIKMYELAEFSEWNIVGQPFDTIKPGGEMEAVIAAESGSPAQAKGQMVWRIQVRAGGSKDKSYSTVVAFEFTPEMIRS